MISEEEARTIFDLMGPELRKALIMDHLNHVKNNLLDEVINTTANAIKAKKNEEDGYILGLFVGAQKTMTKEGIDMMFAVAAYRLAVLKAKEDTSI